MPSAQLGREQTCCFIVISQSQISIGSPFLIHMNFHLEPVEKYAIYGT